MRADLRLLHRVPIGRGHGPLQRHALPQRDVDPRRVGRADIDDVGLGACDPPVGPLRQELQPGTAVDVQLVQPRRHVDRVRAVGLALLARRRRERQRVRADRGRRHGTLAGVADRARDPADLFEPEAHRRVALRKVGADELADPSLARRRLRADLVGARGERQPRDAVGSGRCARLRARERHRADPQPGNRPVGACGDHLQEVGDRRRRRPHRRGDRGRARNGQEPEREPFHSRLTYRRHFPASDRESPRERTEARTSKWRANWSRSGSC